MAQILDPLPSENNISILCCYVNATSQIQIVRISNILNWYFERVVFPGQRLVFEAVPEAILEIHSGMMASAILTDKIVCDRLKMEEETNLSAVPVVEQKSEKASQRSKFEPVNKKAKETLEPLTSLA